MDVDLALIGDLGPVWQEVTANPACLGAGGRKGMAWTCGLCLSRDKVRLRFSCPLRRSSDLRYPRTGAVFRWVVAGCHH